jgi:hypothetical protein
MSSRGALAALVRAIVCVFLAAGVLVYGLLYVASVLNAVHVDAVRASQLATLRWHLNNYRERFGHWPDTLEDLLEKQRSSGMTEGDIRDPIAKQPWLYYPRAPFGTTSILVMQPEPLQVGLWPLVRVHRHGVRADGRICEVQPRDIRGGSD